MPVITFLGHACFLLEDDSGVKDTLLFDPFISGNPLAPVKIENLEPSYILVSHAHFDHHADTYAIAENSSATVISTAEIATEAQGRGCAAHALHIGGRHAFPFGSVKLTPALHGSGIAGGHACGFLVDYHGKKIYFAGDTGLFGDMKLIGEPGLDLALLPIGDNFTMGPEDAVTAASMLKAATVIPYHYNTWPLIEVDPGAFSDAVEQKTGSRCVILAPGEKHTL